MNKESWVEMTKMMNRSNHANVKKERRRKLKTKKNISGSEMEGREEE